MNRPCAFRAALFDCALLLAAPILPLAAPLHAQTDYYNTDTGRPVQIEDAYAIERRALELQLAPFRVERPRGGAYRWGLEPEITAGIFPRTQIEVGFPLAHVERGVTGRVTALSGLEISALYNLNVETKLPAFAIAAETVLPVGGLAGSRASTSIKGIATRTLSWARFHVNAQVTLDADAADSTAVGSERSRWLTGVAIDRTFPLRSLLVTAEIVARQPVVRSADLTWDTAAGLRYQVSPRIATDLGGGYRLRGDDAGWFLTAGAAVAIGLPWRINR